MRSSEGKRKPQPQVVPKSKKDVSTGVKRERAKVEVGAKSIVKKETDRNSEKRSRL